jgi:hypothetical protein
LAVVTFSQSTDPCSPGGTPSLYLYNAHATVSNGPGPPAPQLLKTITLGSAAFSQPAFADGYLFVAGESNGNLMAYASPGPQPPPVSPPPVSPPPVSPPPVNPPPTSSSGITPGGAITLSTVSTAQIKADLVTQLAPVGKAAKIAALLKKRGFTFRFRTLTGGRLEIDWYSIASAQRGKSKVKPVLVAIGKAAFSKAGLVKLTIKLTRAGGRMLKPARSVTLIADGIYRPTSNTAVTATKKFTLRR